VLSRVGVSLMVVVDMVDCEEVVGVGGCDTVVEVVVVGGPGVVGLVLLPVVVDEVVGGPGVGRGVEVPLSSRTGVGRRLTVVVVVGVGLGVTVLVLSTSGGMVVVLARVGVMRREVVLVEEDLVGVARNVEEVVVSVFTASVVVVVVVVLIGVTRGVRVESTRGGAGVPRSVVVALFCVGV
jgi:hypothetical protein